MRACQFVIRRFSHLKLHPDGEAFLVVVFDLGFGQRGFFNRRPHHGLGALIERAVHQELHEFLGDHRLGMIIHGDIGVWPVAGDAQTLELLALDVDPALGELAALLTEFDDRHRVLVLALLAVLLFDFPLDWQAVAIPARHIAAVKTHHLMRADDHVLDGLVQRMANVQMAVCIGGAVVQDERLAAFLFAQTIIDADLLPAFQPCGLALGQACAHGEIGFGKVQRVFVFGRGFGFFGAHIGGVLLHQRVGLGIFGSVRSLKHLCPASRLLRAPGL